MNDRDLDKFDIKRSIAALPPYLKVYNIPKTNTGGDLKKAVHNYLGNPFDSSRMELLLTELYAHFDQGMAESLQPELLQIDHEAAWRFDNRRD